MQFICERFMQFSFFIKIIDFLKPLNSTEKILMEIEFGVQQ